MHARRKAPTENPLSTSGQRTRSTPQRYPQPDNTQTACSPPHPSSPLNPVMAPQSQEGSTSEASTTGRSRTIKEGRYDYADITVDDDSDDMAEWAHNLGYQAKAIGDNKVRLYNTAELPSHEGFSSEDMYNSVGWHTAQCRELGIPRVWEGRSDIYLHMLASDNPRHKDVLFKEMHDHVDKVATRYLSDESTSREAGLRAEAADRVQSGRFSTEPPVRTTFHEGPDGERVPDSFGDWNHEVERIWESSPKDRHALKNRAPVLIDALRRGDAKTFREQMDALKKETTDIDW